jgi:4a-hydroxytetrahydrobiopterin dehydratase
MSKQIIYVFSLCLLLWSYPNAAAGEELSKKQCIPCSGLIPALKGEELHQWAQTLGEGWSLVGEHHIEKIYEFTNFADALAFTNLLGSLAETNGHHPTIIISYSSVKVLLWTYKISGLSESDFIMAAKIDELQPLTQ